MKTDTTLLNVTIPARFVRLCADWAGGTDCMLRAIDSTGSLTLGSQRPYSSEAGRHLTDREWHVTLFDSLASDIRAIFRLPFYASQGKQDYRKLRSFELWAEYTANRLRLAYNLEDSDVV